MSDFTPNTIVLVDGLWITRAAGRAGSPTSRRTATRSSPRLPGFESRSKRFRENPDIIANQTVPAIIDHISSMIGELDKQPIIMGHSFGGTITQLLLDRGLELLPDHDRLRADRGCPGQPAIRGQVAVPGAEEPGQPAPRGRVHPQGVPLRVHQHIEQGGLRQGLRPLPHRCPGSFVSEFGLFANFKPGKQDTWVNYRNDDRAPLLFIAGRSDHIMPPSVNKSTTSTGRRSRRHSPSTTSSRPLALDVRRAGLAGSG